MSLGIIHSFMVSLCGAASFRCLRGLGCGSAKRIQVRLLGQMKKD